MDLVEQWFSILERTLIQDFFAVFWQDYNVIFALPFDRGLILPISQVWSCSVPGAFFLEDRFFNNFTQEIADPFQFSPAKPVVYKFK